MRRWAVPAGFVLMAIIIIALFKVAGLLIVLALLMVTQAANAATRFERRPQGHRRSDQSRGAESPPPD
jgi:ABC-type Mn2+/Zn2+ transport system permease subunit